MENQDKDRILQSFIDLVKEGRETKQRLLKSKTYKIIQDLAEFYIEKGMVSATIKLDELDNELSLSSNYYEDLIDIYFMEKCEVASPLRDAKLDLILTIGVSFDENGIDYLSKFAFQDCSAQGPSLFLITLYTKVGAVKSYVRNKLKENFFSLDEKHRKLTIMALEERDVDTEFLNTIKNLKENVSLNDEIKRNNKKWWQFWK